MGHKNHYFGVKSAPKAPKKIVVLDQILLRELRYLLASSYPPGGGGVVWDYWYMGDKKSGLLVSEKTKIGIWPAEGRKILEI